VHPVILTFLTLSIRRNKNALPAAECNAIVRGLSQSWAWIGFIHWVGSRIVFILMLSS